MSFFFRSPGFSARRRRTKTTLLSRLHRLPGIVRVRLAVKLQQRVRLVRRRELARGVLLPSSRGRGRVSCGGRSSVREEGDALGFLPLLPFLHGRARPGHSLVVYRARDDDERARGRRRCRGSGRGGRGGWRRRCQRRSKNFEGRRQRHRCCQGQRGHFRGQLRQSRASLFVAALDSSASPK